MSKRGSTSKRVISKRPAPASGDVLKVFLSEKNNNDFSTKLFKAVDKSSIDAVDGIIAHLEQLGFDFESSRAFLKTPAEIIHCVRCHQEYDPRMNMQTACTIRHWGDCGSEGRKDRGTYFWTYKCCRKEEEGSYSRPYVRGNCFIGPHTGERRTIRYNKYGPRTCDDTGCSIEYDEDEDEEDSEAELGSDDRWGEEERGPVAKRTRYMS